jgi:hypothetical protein
VDLADRDVSLCTGDDGGWSLDAPYPGAVRLHGAAGGEGALEGVMARFRLTRDRACVERLMGSSATAPELSPAPTRSDMRTIDVSVLSGRTRVAVRCAKR